jgi:hypothetical protein
VWEGGTPNSRRDGWCWCWCFGAPSRAARWWWPGRPCFSFWVLVSVLVPDPVRRGRAWARVWRANGRRRGARACGGVGRKFGVEWSGVVTSELSSAPPACASWYLGQVCYRLLVDYYYLLIKGGFISTVLKSEVKCSKKKSLPRARMKQFLPLHFFSL